MATIGYRAAVADAFGVLVTGWIAYIMWAFIHVLYLVGWGNRHRHAVHVVRAMLFSKNRSHRIITYSRAKKDINTGRITRPDACRRSCPR